MRTVIFNIFLTNSGTISEKNEIFGMAIYKELDKLGKITLNP